MSNPTSNFGWQMPTPTDLVTSLPADFEVFGQAVDSTLADLKGGTTGQVLSKNSNTDMDFVWVTDAAGDITGVTAGTGISGGGTSGTVTITNSMATEITAKGDLIVGTGSATFDNLAAGTNGAMLVADSTQSTGLAWKTNSTQFPWASYSPSTGGITIGNATVSTKWAQIGKTVFVNIFIILGSTSAITGDLRFSLPVGANKFSGGSGWVEDSGTVYPGLVLINYTDIYLRAINTSGTYALSNNLSSTVPFTWGTGDLIILQATYEAA